MWKNGTICETENERKRMKEDEKRCSQGKVRTQRLAYTFNPGTKSLRFAATVEAN